MNYAFGSHQEIINRAWRKWKFNITFGLGMATEWRDELVGRRLYLYH
jgi:hypothetical protein